MLATREPSHHLTGRTGEAETDSIITASTQQDQDCCAVCSDGGREFVGTLWYGNQVEHPTKAEKPIIGVVGVILVAANQR